MKLGARLAAAKDASGQALVLTVIFLVVLLGFAGFAIDVGHAYLVQRQLQAGVDAAALAGAQELPVEDQAILTANEYGPTPALAGNPSKRNDVTTVDNAVTNVTIKCLRTYGCVGRRAKKNGIEVTATSDVPTWFARVLGRNSFTVRASSTACSPCAIKGFDVMIVLDRTGSMCTGTCADFNNAKDGIRQFLKAMDPGLDKVGLAVFPPVLEATSNCDAPYQGTRAGRNGRRYGYDAWWPDWDRRNRNGSPATGDTSKYAIVSPEFDYLAESSTDPGEWDLTGSALNATLDCLQAAGNTSYANAIAEAKRELVVHGNGVGPAPDSRPRGNAPDVIVFVTDGAANTMPRRGVLPTNPVADGLLELDLEPYGTNTGSPVNRPCRAGVIAADWAKAQSTLIYTIGFGLAGGGNGEQCNEPGGTALNPETTLQAMATDGRPTGGTYYGTPEGADLGLVFEQIAYDIRERQGRLVPQGSS